MKSTNVIYEYLLTTYQFWFLLYLSAFKLEELNAIHLKKSYSLQTASTQVQAETQLNFAMYK